MTGAAATAASLGRIIISSLVEPAWRGDDTLRAYSIPHAVWLLFSPDSRSILDVFAPAAMQMIKSALQSEPSYAAESFPL
jgi:hypothetical protein